MSVLTRALPETTDTQLEAQSVPPSVVLIYNTSSGAATQGGGIGLAPLLPSPPDDKPKPPAWLEEAQEYLRRETGTEPKIVATETQDDAIATVRESVAQKVPLVIAAGGDGTLRTVAAELIGTDTALGILPKGTVNVFARELSIPLDDTLAALRIALHGQTCRVDVGRLHLGSNEEPQLFLLMASLGVDASAVENVDQNIKDAVGAPAYVLSGISTFATFVPPTVTMTVHGSDEMNGVAITRTSEPFAVLISNTSLYGGDFRAAPDAKLDDGLVDVMVFDKAPGLPLPLQRANFARQFGAAALGQHKDDPNIHFTRASRLEITCEPETALQVDGDAVGMQTRFAVEVLPQCLAVRC